MKTAVVIQARMGSQRLPGKVLLPLNGHNVLSEVILRCRKIPGASTLVAIPDTQENDCLVSVARAAGATVARGPEHDVLTRYLIAAGLSGADVIMRVTADCPLLSPELCAEVLGKLRKHEADYSSNVMPRTFPRGFDCEAFTVKTLRQADRQSTKEEREHVTPWMQRANIKRVNVESPWTLQGRLTLDTADDYKTICASFTDASGECVRAA